MKKRIIFTLIILIVISFSFSLAIASTIPVNVDKYSSLSCRGDNGDDCGVSYKMVPGADIGGGGDCGFNEPKYKVPAKEGCWFFMTDVDDSDQNDGDWAVVNKGFMLDFEHKEMDVNDSGAECDGGAMRNEKYYSSFGTYFLCSDDSYWHECTSESNGTIAWVKNEIYNCTDQGKVDYPAWEKTPGVDFDQDGYTTPEDCYDGNGYETEQGCPTLDEDTGKINCEYPKHSRCAICINPGAPEICGDGIGTGDVNDPTAGMGNDCNPDTKEDCNNFEEGCEQDTIDSTEEEVTVIFANHGNIFDKSFPWVQTGTKDQGFCCGYNGLDDVGKIVDTSSGQYVCLPRKETGITGTELDETPGGNVFCKDDWCLANAIGVSPAGGKFNILTINKPGEKPYDILSNSQNWYTCDQNNLGEFKEENYPEQGIDPDAYGSLLQVNNRFSCYLEGDHYSWAECASDLDKRKNRETKGRYPGEGLFSLPLDSLETVGGIRTSVGGLIDINSFQYYKKFYGPNHLLDFTGYKYFNFMIQFCKGACTDADVLTLEELQKEKLLPLNIQLTLNGPTKGEPLFEKNVLSDITNGPIEDGKWLHVKTSIPENLLAIKSILLKSHPDTVEMRVRNVYLSKDDEDTELCSGLDSADETSWLNDIDQGTSQSNIVGKNLCTALYGDSAWLGKDNDLDPGFASANCCGDDPSEYYAGKTKENADSSQFGCWNSKPIADKETAMTVEFDVGYKDINRLREEETISVSGLTLDHYTEPFLAGELISNKNWDWADDKDNLVSESRLNADQVGADQFCIDKGYTTATYKEEACILTPSKELIATYYTEEERLIWETVEDIGWFSEHCGDGDEVILDSVLTEVTCSINLTPGWNTLPADVNLYLNNPSVVIANFTPAKIATFNPLNKLGFVASFDVDERVELEAYSSISFRTVGTFEEGKLTISPQDIYDDDLYYSSILIVAKLVPENIDFKIDQELIINTSSYSYPCNAEECLYPVPGIPGQGITITNTHPNLYDLYYLYYQDDEVKEKFIKKEETFYVEGNVLARKVSQQIIFDAGTENKVPSFYGCQAADYIQNDPDLTAIFQNNNYCSIQAEKFCSPSVNLQAVGSQDRYTLINSWSDESVEKIGYTIQESDTDNLTTYFDNLVLELKDASPTITPKERNKSSQTIPVRNFIPNAEFRYSGAQIPHWEIHKGDKIIIEEKPYTEEYTIEDLNGNEVLRSEKISITNFTDYYFWQNGTAETTITLYDNNGVEVKQLSQSDLTEPFNSEEGTFLMIEFEDGSVKQPSLQYVDYLGIGNSTYLHQDYPDTFDFRSGTSCCPTNFCWNGYTCVEPMEEVSMMTEHFGVGRDYRCIAGEWTPLPLKWDWNNDLWGFCSQEEQCFVSTKGQATFDTTDFYNGNMPICVNNNESILDHYCLDGNWTTRTKFVASKLLDFAGSDEHVLYCTDYRDALLNYGPEIYLGGECFVEDDQLEGLDAVIGGEDGDNVLNSCFCELQTEEGKRLVPNKDNSCINNVCVLRYKEGGKLKTAFGTTLNKNITNPDSFLLSLGIPQSDLSTVCEGDGEIVECNFGSNKLWYLPELNAVIFDKEGINLGGSVVDSIVDFFKDLFGTESELADESEFVVEAQNFNEVYILNKGGKKIRAVKEIYPGVKQTLIAEYENFNTPVCSYAQNLELPLELQAELLEELSDMEKLECSQEGNVQRIEMIAGLDFFWPQLTGKIRVGSFE